MPIEIFKELSKIPRPSGKEKEVAKFIKGMAAKYNWQCEVDVFNNVLIKKKTSSTRPLILQAHTDMVCVSEAKDFDFEKKGITVLESDGYLTGNKTSLGADNGIGVALALAILKENFPMNLEVLFTSEEETTMTGAKNFDTSKLFGKHLLSLDGSAKATIDISSASSTMLEIDTGGIRTINFSKENQSPKLNVFELEVSGLIGGHSGVDIDKNLGNAFKIMLDFLTLLNEPLILSLKAKVKSNEIPTNCKVVFATANSKEDLNEKLKNYFIDIFNSCYAPKLKINLKTISFLEKNVQAHLNSSVLIDFLNKLDYGVLKQDYNNQVVLSANLYEIDLENAKIKLHLRANDEIFRQSYIEKLKSLTKAFDFKVNELSYLPGFAAKDNGELLAITSAACERVFKFKPNLVNIHAGVECGVFASKIDNLDACVIGAKIDNMHSTKERVEIKSVEQTFNWLKEIVKNFK